MSFYSALLRSLQVERVRYLSILDAADSRTQHLERLINLIQSFEFIDNRLYFLQITPKLRSAMKMFLQDISKDYEQALQHFIKHLDADVVEDSNEYFFSILIALSIVAVFNLLYLVNIRHEHCQMDYSGVFVSCMFLFLAGMLILTLGFFIPTFLCMSRDYLYLTDVRLLHQKFDIEEYKNQKKAMNFCLNQSIDVLKKLHREIQDKQILSMNVFFSTEVLDLNSVWINHSQIKVLELSAHMRFDRNHGPVLEDFFKQLAQHQIRLLINADLFKRPILDLSVQECRFYFGLCRNQNVLYRLKESSYWQCLMLHVFFSEKLNSEMSQEILAYSGYTLS